MPGPLGDLLAAPGLRHWTRLAARADTLPPERLRRARAGALALRRSLDAVIDAARGPLGRPSDPRDAAPPLSDWAWRPGGWSARLPRPGLVAPAPGESLGAGIAIWHDAAAPELILRQRPAPGDGEPAPYALAVETFAFDGAFLSLSLDLPEDGVRGLGPGHIVHCDLVTETDRPLALYARLNVVQGRDTVRVVRLVHPGQGAGGAAFDLAYAGLDDRPPSHAWIDLILDDPALSRLVLRDCVLSRHPRADL